MSVHAKLTALLADRDRLLALRAELQESESAAYEKSAAEETKVSTELAGIDRALPKILDLVKREADKATTDVVNRRRETVQASNLKNAEVVHTLGVELKTVAEAFRDEFEKAVACHPWFMEAIGRAAGNPCRLLAEFDVILREISGRPDAGHDPEGKAALDAELNTLNLIKKEAS